jgi:protoporphyrinogen oxidase
MRTDVPIRFVVLGAGPAGLGLAMRILQRQELHAAVTVLEKKEIVGGLTASFDYEGLTFDYGSHRLHPATAPEIMADLQSLLGKDLLDRPRYGRIRLQRRFVHFPLKPFDLLTKLPPAFVAGFLRDAVAKPFRSNGEQTSFADVLYQGLGRTMCEAFYFPYARKLWGKEPEDLSAVQARRRVAANNFLKIIGKVLSKMPGLRKPGTGRFFYPLHGFGQISEALAGAVRAHGGEVRVNSHIESISRAADGGLRIDLRNADPVYTDHIFSTIPVTSLVRLLRPAPPDAILAAGSNLTYRAMVLHYLILQADQFTPFDAHYFPEESILFSRMSEPKNYSNSAEPRQRTGLCFEIPCQVDDDIWNLSDEQLTDRVLRDLRKSNLPVTCPVLAGFAKRLPFIYPVYDLNFAGYLDRVSEYISTIAGLVTLGRQGLFVHDNTHHGLAMAYKASDCINPDGTWDHVFWQKQLQIFSEHVVED